MTIHRPTRETDALAYWRQVSEALAAMGRPRPTLAKTERCRRLELRIGDAMVILAMQAPTDVSHALGLAEIRVIAERAADGRDDGAEHSVLNHAQMGVRR